MCKILKQLIQKNKRVFEDIQYYWEHPIMFSVSVVIADLHNLNRQWSDLRVKKCNMVYPRHHE